MVHGCLYFSMLLITCMCTSYGENERAIQERGKRSVKALGKLAERILLKEANKVGRAGKKIFYSKGGGYEQALVDFNYVKPQAVRHRFVHHGRVAQAGIIGDREMILLRQEFANPATIHIAKLRNIDVAGGDYPAKVILYYD